MDISKLEEAIVIKEAIDEREDILFKVETNPLLLQCGDSTLILSIDEEAKIVEVIKKKNCKWGDYVAKKPKLTIFRFQQLKLIENNLDLLDALVMNTILDLYSSDRFEQLIIDNKRYIWVKQDYLLSYIPIVGSLSTLKRILTKLSDEGYFETKLVTNKEGRAGRYFYIKYTDKLFSLTEYANEDDCFDNNDVSKVQNDTRPNVNLTFNQSSNWTNKDNSYIDYSNKDNKDISNDNLSINKSKKKLIKIYQEDSFELLIVDALLIKIKELNSNFKNPDKQKWADEIRKMIEIDNRTEEDIISVLKYATSNSFWQSIILSTKKFREKYDMLYMQMNRSNPNRKVADF